MKHPFLALPICLWLMGVLCPPFAAAQTVRSPAAAYSSSFGQEPARLPATDPKADQTISNTVGQTNSMDVLNSDTKLGKGDSLSYRVVEERTPPIPMIVTDSGEVEVPFIGRVKAAGKTCKQLAYEIKPMLEKEYFYRATVVVGLSTLSNRSRGKVYLMGQIKTQGAMDLPADEILTVSKVILRAGGLADFADRRKIKLVRKKPGTQPDLKGGIPTFTTIVDLREVLDRGHTEKDPAIEPDDLIIAPERLINF